MQLQCMAALPGFYATDPWLAKLLLSCLMQNSHPFPDQSHKTLNFQAIPSLEKPVQNPDFFPISWPCVNPENFQKLEQKYEVSYFFRHVFWQRK